MGAAAPPRLRPLRVMIPSPSPPYRVSSRIGERRGRKKVSPLARSFLVVASSASASPVRTRRHGDSRRDFREGGRERGGRGEGERIVTLSGSRFGQYYRDLRCVRVRRLAAETLNDVGIYSRLSVGLDRPDLDSRNHLARSRRRRRRAFTGPPRRPAVLPIGGNGRSFHPRTIQRRHARPRAHESV